MVLHLSTPCARAHCARPHQQRTRTGAPPRGILQTNTLFDAADGWRQWIDPPLLEALDAQNATALRSLLREEVGEVYSFRMMSDDFCRMFLEELDHYYSTGLPM